MFLLASVFKPADKLLLIIIIIVNFTYSDLCITGLGLSLSLSLFAMAETKGKFDFAIDRGGTFTDVFARLPDGRERVLKLLSRDPQNYKDAPTEGIRRVLEEVFAIVMYCIS